MATSQNESISTAAGTPVGDVSGASRAMQLQGSGAGVQSGASHPQQYQSGSAAQSTAFNGNAARQQQYAAAQSGSAGAYRQPYTNASAQPYRGQVVSFPGGANAAAMYGRQPYGQDGVYIDLMQLFSALWKRFWNLLLAGLICASIAAGITYSPLVKDVYTSTSMMIVLTKETTLTSLADLQLGTHLTNDYKVLIQSRPILKQVIKNLDLEDQLDYKTLRNNIEVTNGDDTRILEISVNMPTPQLAKEVCDELADISAEYIGRQMEVQPPKVIEYGELPISKTSPSMTKNVIIGFLIGVLLMAAVIVVREILNDTITSEEDVERYLPGAAVLAVIPNAVEDTRKQRQEAEKSEKEAKEKEALYNRADSRYVALQEPLGGGDYFYREAVKTLRANILFTGKNRKVLMFTSVYQGEGKSLTVFHLAQDMAKLGKRILLVDADIRNSQLVSRFGVTKKVNGLSEYLSGQVDDPNQILYATNFDNLFITFSGAVAPNPAELLAERQFKGYVESARKVFDYVFIDTPPLGQVVDAAQIGQVTDGAVLLIESGAVSYYAAQKVMQQLEQADIHVLGTVLNKVDREEAGLYGKYGKYGKYGRYGHYGKYGYGYGKYGYGEEPKTADKAEAKSGTKSEAGSPSKSDKK